jgi:aspartate kinase
VKVAKFGGSSVKDALSMRRCADIVINDSSLGLVIISATHNTTNQLEDICLLMKEDPARSLELVDQVCEKHLALARELAIEHDQMSLFIREVESLEASIALLKSGEAVTPELKDLVLSWGERVSSFLFFSILKGQVNEERSVTWLNACDYISTDSSFGLATVNIDLIKSNCSTDIKNRFENKELFITQGFIGSDQQGRVTTLGREGSDYSAALFASALAANEVQIWTDVDGVYQCDPNIVPTASRIPFLSYEQATVMAKSGAKVLFGKTLAPLKDQMIPVYVKSSIEPMKEGTLISEKGFLEERLLSLAVKVRSDGVIVTLVGNGLDQIETEQSEIDCGEGFRSFFIPNKGEEEALSLWYARYFSV